MSRSFRQRLLAIIAAFALVTVIRGYTAHGFAAHRTGTDRADWAMHFTGVAGSAPKPVPLARPVLAARVASAWERRADRGGASSSAFPCRSDGQTPSENPNRQNISPSPTPV